MKSGRTAFAALLAILAVLWLAEPCAAKVYRWTDDEGNSHFTLDPNKVPEKYRERPEGEAKSAPGEAPTPARVYSPAPAGTPTPRPIYPPPSFKTPTPRPAYIPPSFETPTPAPVPATATPEAAETPTPAPGKQPGPEAKEMEFDEAFDRVIKEHPFAKITVLWLVLLFLMHPVFIFRAFRLRFFFWAGLMTFNWIAMIGSAVLGAEILAGLFLILLIFTPSVWVFVGYRSWNRLVYNLIYNGGLIAMIWLFYQIGMMIGD